MPFGQTTTNVSGGASAAAEGNLEYLPGGITMDWSTVPANASDATLADGTVIPAGVKYLPFGLVLCKITATGLWGPHDAAASDGRQTPTRGSVGILNSTVTFNNLHKDNPPGVFEGGSVYAARVKRVTTGAYTTDGLTSGVLAALPRLRVVNL